MSLQTRLTLFFVMLFFAIPLVLAVPIALTLRAKGWL